MADSPQDAWMDLGFFDDAASRALASIEAVRAADMGDGESPMPRMFNLKEASELLGGMPDSTIRKRIKEGEFPAGHPDYQHRQRRFTLEHINEMRRVLGQEVSRPAGAPPAIVAVANAKGGVSKTTMAIHLGQYCVMQGYRTLVVDMDPQASMTATCGLQPDAEVDEGDSFLPYVAGEESDLRYAVRSVPHWDRLDLIPAATGLSQIDFLLPVRQQQSPGTYAFYRQLLDGLRTIEDDYDIIVIDTPPNMTYGALNCVFAAQGLVIPLPARPPDYDSARKFSEFLASLLGEQIGKQDSDQPLAWTRVVVSQYQRHHATVAGYIRAAYSPMVLDHNWEYTPVLHGDRNTTIYDLSSYEGDSRTWRRATDMADRVNAALLRQIETYWAQHTGQQENRQEAINE